MHLVRRRAPDLLAALFGVSSMVHLLRPSVFESLIPSWLGNPRAVVYVSGAAEVVCALGLSRRTRWAHAASVLLLVAVFPGNIQQAVNSVHDGGGHVTGFEVLSFVRLPLQIPLIWAALQATAKRRSSESPSPLGIAGS